MFIANDQAEAPLGMGCPDRFMLGAQITTTRSPVDAMLGASEIEAKHAISAMLPLKSCEVEKSKPQR